MAAGRFFTIEGGEGTGKSTLIHGLVARLRDADISCVTSREPGGTPLAEDVRQLVLHPRDGSEWSPLATALLMNAARDDHLARKIRPALAAGEWVLCDRFADSTRAYQSIDGVAPATLKQFEMVVLGETKPDLTFILDADPSALEARRAQRGTLDAFEKKEAVFHVQVRDAFLEIARQEPERCIVLDALQPPGDIVDAAMTIISQRYLNA